MACTIHKPEEKQIKTEELVKFTSGCSDIISDVLTDLEKLNIGLAKDKLYVLLKQSAQLLENMEKSKNLGDGI